MAKKIISTRQGGKTFKLLKISESTKYPIIVSDIVEANKLYKMAREHNIIIPEPISINQIINNWERGKRIDGVLIDDVDRVLETIIHNKLSPYTTIDTITINVDKRKSLFKKICELFNGGKNEREITYIP